MLARQRGARIARRGPGRFKFGYADIAAACGRALDTVRTDLRLDARVEAVAVYVIRALGQRAHKLTEAEAVAVFGCAPAAWAARTPRFDVYRCAIEECPALLLEPTVCGQHGGSRQPFAIIGRDHIQLRLAGEYLPLCRVVVGARADRVDHADSNSWNCAPDNLTAVGLRQGGRRTWSFGYPELAALLDMSEDAVRQAVTRGALNPGSLASVCSFWALAQG